jgi:hypothetical protein
MIHYYCTYCRMLKENIHLNWYRESITYTNISDPKDKIIRTCPIYCTDMEFIIYLKKGFIIM